jgi:hypothetical protein
MPDLLRRLVVPLSRLEEAPIDGASLGGQRPKNSRNQKIEI